MSSIRQPVLSFTRRFPQANASASKHILPRFFPSSKTCHGCNWKWEDMELSDRIFICQHPACPLFQVPQDRDQNASQNVVSLADTYLASLR
jgi:transposase